MKGGAVYKSAIGGVIGVRLCDNSGRHLEKVFLVSRVEVIEARKGPPDEFPGAGLAARHGAKQDEQIKIISRNGPRLNRIDNNAAHL
jgi:hypothetical protein